MIYYSQASCNKN